MANITIGGRLVSNARFANLDQIYGPYDNDKAALAALGNRVTNANCIGLTVGIKQSDGTIKEFWLQPAEGNTTLRLVEKNTDLTKAQGLTSSQKHELAANINDRAADVVAETGVVRALGYKVLDPRKSFASQVEGVNNANTIFEIKDSFDLEGGSVTIPDNCTLKFNGGSLMNGELVGQNTAIEAGLVKIFENNIVFKGTFNIGESYPEWFGAIGDGISDDSEAIQSVLDLAKFRESEDFSKKGTSVFNVLLTRNKNYFITKTLIVYPFTCLGGSNENAIIESYPTIKAGTGINTIKLSDYAVLSNAARIHLHNMSISGYENGVVIKEGVGLNDSYFNNLYFGGSLKRGLSFDTSGVVVDLIIENIRATTAIEIPIYINSTSYVWGIFFKNLFFTYTKIGGVYLKTSKGITRPVIFENCLFDNTGTDYNLESYSKFGSWAIYLDYPYGIVDIKDCYFELTCPLHKNKEEPQSYGDFVEAKTITKYTYITNPDFKKTASIVVRGMGSSRLNVHSCHFTIAYLTISAVNGGNISFYDNKIEIAHVPTYGINTKGFPIQKGIIKVFDFIDSYFSRFALDITHLLNYAEYNSTSSIKDYIKEGYDTDGKNALRLTAKVNIPALNRVFEYSYLNRLSFGDATSLVFLDKNFTGFSNGTPVNPFTYLDAALNVIPRSKDVKVILMSDWNINAQVTLPPGLNIEFYSYESKTITFNSVLYADSSKLIFTNVSLVQNGITSGVRITNSEVLFTHCNITMNVSNNAYGIVTNTKGVSKVNLNKCTITRPDGVTPGKFIKGDSDSKMLLVHMSDTTNTKNIPYDDNSDAPFKGSTRPVGSKIYVGFQFFDTSVGINKPIYASAINGDTVTWVDANGDYIVDISGTLQNRLALTSPVKGQQFKLTGGVNDVYLSYGGYGWLKATDGTPWFDDSGTLNAMYDKYNYTLLTEQPSDWATKYNTYYKIVNGVYTLLATLETWASDTYYKKDVNVNKGIQVKLTDTDVELLNKVVKWNGTKYINIVDNVALKAGTPTITFTTENNTTTATITSTSNGKIYYTKDGSTPTSSSTEYSSAITLADGDQVKAICIRDHMDNSTDGFKKVANPVITFSNAGILTITCETPDVKIYYTIDGNNPSTSSTEYDSSTSVTIAKNVTVKAFAVLIGRVNSDVSSKKRS